MHIYSLHVSFSNIVPDNAQNYVLPDSKVFIFLPRGPFEGLPIGSLLQHLAGPPQPPQSLQSSSNQMRLAKGSRALYPCRHTTCRDPIGFEQIYIDIYIERERSIWIDMDVYLFKCMLIY